MHKPRQPKSRSCEEEAVVREPILRRPNQSTISDNPFATSYEHVDTFFNNACAVALLARCLAEPRAAAPLAELFELFFK